MAEQAGSAGWGDKLLLAGIIVYTLVLCFATADDILGWGLLAVVLR